MKIENKQFCWTHMNSWQQCNKHLLRKLQTIHYGNWKEESSNVDPLELFNVWPNDYNKSEERKRDCLLYNNFLTLIAHRPAPKHSRVLYCVDYRNATQSFPKFKCFYLLYFWVAVVECSGSCYTFWLISLHTMNTRDWKDCSNELNTLTHVCVHACEICISLQLSTQTHLTCYNLTKCDQFQTIRTNCISGRLWYHQLEHT